MNGWMNGKPFDLRSVVTDLNQNPEHSLPVCPLMAHCVSDNMTVGPSLSCIRCPPLYGVQARVLHPRTIWWLQVLQPSFYDMILICPHSHIIQIYLGKFIGNTVNNFSL